MLYFPQSSASRTDAVGQGAPRRTLFLRCVGLLFPMMLASCQGAERYSASDVIWGLVPLEHAAITVSYEYGPPAYSPEQLEQAHLVIIELGQFNDADHADGADLCDDVKAGLLGVGFQVVSDRSSADMLVKVHGAWQLNPPIRGPLEAQVEMLPQWHQWDSSQSGTVWANANVRLEMTALSPRDFTLPSGDLVLFNEAMVTIYGNVSYLPEEGHQGNVFGRVVASMFDVWPGEVGRRFVRPVSEVSR